MAPMSRSLSWLAGKLATNTRANCTHHKPLVLIPLECMCIGCVHMQDRVGDGGVVSTLGQTFSQQLGPCSDQHQVTELIAQSQLVCTQVMQPTDTSIIRSAWLTQRSQCGASATGAYLCLDFSKEPALQGRLCTTGRFHPPASTGQAELLHVFTVLQSCVQHMQHINQGICPM